MIQGPRVVQLSDPHLVGPLAGRVRTKPALAHWDAALDHAIALQPDLLLITGDCCQDESWNGYARLRDSLRRLPQTTQVAVAPGNHDHPGRLRCCLGARVTVAPAIVRMASWDVILLSSHWSGHTGGRIGSQQRRWLRDWAIKAPTTERPLLLALHHPPIAVGQQDWDAIGLEDRNALIVELQQLTQLKGVVFGHLHQHWHGTLPGRTDVRLLGCPSTLCAFPAIQPCPQGRCHHPGGRLMELNASGDLAETLVRWVGPSGI